MVVAARFKTPRGERVLVGHVGEYGIGRDEYDVEVIDADGEVVAYFPGLTGSAVQRLAVQRGWSPCR